MACGDDLNTTMNITNNSSHKRHVTETICIRAMSYTGVPADTILSVPFDRAIDKGETYRGKLVVKAESYIHKLQDGCLFDLSVLAMVKETDQCFVINEDFMLTKPDINIQGPSEAKKDQPIDMELSFQNPLDTPLTDCEVTVDGLSKSVRFPQKDVSAKGYFKTTVSVTPTKVGKKELVVVFSSKQLDDINGSKRIVVRSRGSQGARAA